MKTTLYRDNVHDSYAICPEKLLKNEYYIAVSVGTIFDHLPLNEPRTVSCRARYSCRMNLGRGC